MPRDPFANFDRMRREMDEIFGGILERGGLAHRRGFSPRVDVYYEGGDDRPARAVVAAELPGVDISAVRLEIRGRKLLIAGERRAQSAEGRVYQQIEVESGPFRRVVELGADVAGDEAAATYDDGILRVEVPLARSELEARRVPIGSAREGGGGDPGELPERGGER